MLRVQAQVPGQNRALDQGQNQNRKVAERKSVHTHHLLRRPQKGNATNIPVNQRVRSTDLGRKNQRKDYGILQKIGLTHGRGQRKDLCQMIPTRRSLPKDGIDHIHQIDVKAADMDAVEFMHHHQGGDLQCLVGTPEKSGGLAQGIEKKEVHGKIDAIAPGQLLEECQIKGQGVESKDLLGVIDVIIPGQFLEGDQIQGQYVEIIVHH